MKKPPPQADTSAQESLDILSKNAAFRMTKNSKNKLASDQAQKWAGIGSGSPDLASHSKHMTGFGLRAKRK
jgi:hypothetical protein